MVTHFSYWHRAISLGSRQDRRVRATRRLAHTHRSGPEPVVGILYAERREDAFAVMMMFERRQHHSASKVDFFRFAWW